MVDLAIQDIEKEDTQAQLSEDVQHKSTAEPTTPDIMVTVSEEHQDRVHELASCTSTSRLASRPISSIRPISILRQPRSGNVGKKTSKHVRFTDEPEGLGCWNEFTYESTHGLKIPVHFAKAATLRNNHTDANHPGGCKEIIPEQMPLVLVEPKTPKDIPEGLKTSKERLPGKMVVVMMKRTSTYEDEWCGGPEKRFHKLSALDMGKERLDIWSETLEKQHQALKRQHDSQEKRHKALAKQQEAQEKLRQTLLKLHDSLEKERQRLDKRERELKNKEWGLEVRATRIFVPCDKLCRGGKALDRRYAEQEMGGFGSQLVVQLWKLWEMILIVVLFPFVFMTGIYRRESFAEEMQ